MRFKFVLPLPRFVFHPLTALVIAAIHVYLAYTHIAALTAGQVEWVHIWKGFGALFGAYVFAALASRRIPMLHHFGDSLHEFQSCSERPSELNH
jgi:hypothetical protein